MRLGTWGGALFGAVLVACGGGAVADAPAQRATAPRQAAVAPDAAAPQAPDCTHDAFGLGPGGEEAIAARIEAKRGTMGRARKQMVVTSHALATDAALAVLRAGGNAADAFVAAVLAQDVVLPGVTSTAGLTGILVYEAKTKKVTYVHGGVADPVDPARRRREGDTATGKLVLVPGAPAAYAELVKRFGKKPLAFDVEPAAKLAGDGFPADKLYARSILGARKVLERSAYAKKTYLPGGEPIGEGATLRLPEVAKAYRAFGKDPTYFHRGRWADAAVALANENGGTLRKEDFATYAAEVAPALHGTFMGHEVYGGGHGGLKALASLGALERLRGGSPARAPNASIEDLERTVRIFRQAASLPDLSRRDLVMRGESVDVASAADVVADGVRRNIPAAPPRGAGTHSSAAVVVDAEGNIVVGTHTIETFNWGEGLFVEGIALSTSAGVSFDDPAAATKTMRIDPLSATIALKDGTPRAALTVYGTGLHPADVQILDAVLARGVDAEDAVLAPRVGYYQFDFGKMAVDKSVNVVDPRFPPLLLCEARRRGLELARGMPPLPPGVVDTGFPNLVTFRDGELHGMPPDPGHIHGVAKGE